MAMTEAVSDSKSVRVLIAGLLTAMAVGLFVVPLRLLPDVALPEGALSLEFVIHVGLTAAVAMAWVWALPGVSIPVLVALGLVFAGVAEALQALPFVERTPRLQDFGYNIIGVLVGIAVAALLRRFRR